MKANLISAAIAVAFTTTLATFANASEIIDKESASLVSATSETSTIRENEIDKVKTTVESNVSEIKKDAADDKDVYVKKRHKLIEVKDSDIEMLDSLMSGYKSKPLDNDHIQYETDSIAKLEELYFSKGIYTGKDIEELFVNFISMGLNKAADYIIDNENVDIDVNGFNEKGITPLIATAISVIEGGNSEYAVKLIKMGADVNLGTELNEMTPASFASITDNYQTLAIFLASGAKFMKIDRLDYRPIDYAIANNSENSAAILSEALSARVKFEMSKEPILNEVD